MMGKIEMRISPSDWAPLRWGSASWPASFTSCFLSLPWTPTTLWSSTKNRCWTVLNPKEGVDSSPCYSSSSSLRGRGRLLALSIFLASSSWLELPPVFSLCFLRYFFWPSIGFNRSSLQSASYAYQTLHCIWVNIYIYIKRIFIQ